MSRRYNWFADTLHLVNFCQAYIFSRYLWSFVSWLPSAFINVTVTHGYIHLESISFRYQGWNEIYLACGRMNKGQHEYFYKQCRNTMETIYRLYTGEQCVLTYTTHALMMWTKMFLHPCRQRYTTILLYPRIVKIYLMISMINVANKKMRRNLWRYARS